MKPFKRILVATDFGESAERALQTAIALAMQFNAELVLFHASTVPPMSVAAAVSGFTDPSGELMEADEKAFDALVAEVKSKVPLTEAVLATADPWGAILEAARKREVDLIVVGTHGRRGLSRVFLGSVAEKVVRMSPVPVLIVPGSTDAAAKEQALAAS